MSMEGKKKKVDGVSGANKKKTVQAPKALPKKTAPQKEIIKVTIGKVPHRGPVWYSLFIFSFVVLNGISIYFREWFVLFFVFVFYVGTLWRGHMASSFEIMPDDECMVANGKKYYYENIESYYFSRNGDDLVLNLHFLNKFYPRMSFTLVDSKQGEYIRNILSHEVPETRPEEERLTDLLIRKLKL